MKSLIYSAFWRTLDVTPPRDSQDLARPHDGATVVVPRHAPHPDSLSSRHADLDWCDASDLSGLIEERGPDLWAHGHVHRHADYRVGRTRIVCNARGHADEVTDFIPDIIAEVE